MVRQRKSCSFIELDTSHSKSKSKQHQSYDKINSSHYTQPNQDRITRPKSSLGQESHPLPPKPPHQDYLLDRLKDHNRKLRAKNTFYRQELTETKTKSDSASTNMRKLIKQNLNLKMDLGIKFLKHKKNEQ